MKAGPNLAALITARGRCTGVTGFDTEVDEAITTLGGDAGVQAAVIHVGVPIVTAFITGSIAIATSITHNHSWGPRIAGTSPIRCHNAALDAGSRCGIDEMLTTFGDNHLVLEPENLCFDGVIIGIFDLEVAA